MVRSVWNQVNSGSCSKIMPLWEIMVQYCRFKSNIVPRVWEVGIILYFVCDELTVVHPSRKNGEVTESQNHTIFLLSWQGFGQFGFKLKKWSTLENFEKNRTFFQQANTTPCLLMCDLCQPLMQIGVGFHVWLISTTYGSLCWLSKHCVVDLLQVHLFDGYLNCPVFCK